MKIYHFTFSCVASALLLMMTFTTKSYAASDFPDNTIQVMVSIEQKITLEGKPVEPAKLPDRLKSMGAKPDTIIRILIQKNTPDKTLKDISRALASAGYRKFVFTQPKQAEVSVKDPGGK